MSRRTLVAVMTALVATASWGATTGFDATFEESTFVYPPTDTPLTSDFAAPVGTFEILTPDYVHITSSDPVNGPLCDPTTFRGLVGDTATSSNEVRLAFPMAAGLRPGTVIFDKVEIGHELGDRFGAEWGVYSGETMKYEPIVQFGPNNQLYVYGQPATDPATGDPILYGNLWDNECFDSAAWTDNHITLISFHDMGSGAVALEVRLHGPGAASYMLGPYLMNPETQSEGIGGMFLRSPRSSGRWYLDGMVCNGQTEIVVPSGESPTGGGRTRY